MCEKDNGDLTNNEIIYRALMMWANYIETSDVNLSSNDAINMRRYNKINILDLYQQKFICRLRELAQTELIKSK